MFFPRKYPKDFFLSNNDFWNLLPILHDQQTVLLNFPESPLKYDVEFNLMLIVCIANGIMLIILLKFIYFFPYFRRLYKFKHREGSE